ncbi:hypothetical protein M8J77_025109 [Diaphorina citri]|nr:hypothetical protein M8J77_025109 [Diaphorina citri]
MVFVDGGIRTRDLLHGKQARYHWTNRAPGVEMTLGLHAGGTGFDSRVQGECSDHYAMGADEYVSYKHST